MIDTLSSTDFQPSSYKYLIAFGKPAGDREVIPRELDVHSRWKSAREQKRKEGEEETSEG